LSTHTTEEPIIILPGTHNLPTIVRFVCGDLMFTSAHTSKHKPTDSASSRVSMQSISNVLKKGDKKPTP
jgi:hypothetical protein